VGYLGGLAITIFVSQLPKLFGYSVEGGNLVADIRDFLTNLDQTNIWALGVGLLTLVIILGFKRWAPRAPGILFAVIGAIAVTVLLDLAAKGVDTVGVLPQGFPKPSFPLVDVSDLAPLAAAAFGITLVAIGDTISTSAGFAARRGYEVDSDQELVGIGSANLLATQLTGIVAAAAVLAMLLFVPGLVKNLPQPALAAIVIVAAISLFDGPALRHLWNVRRSEFVLAVICILGVGLVGVLEGIVIAVGVAIFQIFAAAWRPHSAVLGKPENVSGYHDLERYPGAQQTDGLLMIRWDAPLIFANANLFRNFVREQVAGAPSGSWWPRSRSPMSIPPQQICW